jgi:hypothetical protein
MIENILFRFFIYCAIGIFFEVIISAITKIVTKEVLPPEAYRLTGFSYLWMIFIYGVGLTFIFEPILKLILMIPINKYIILFPIGFVVWGIMFTLFEALCGFIIYKIIGFCPWSIFPKEQGGILGGFTKWYMFPIWGLMGILFSFITLKLWMLMGV